MTCLRSPFLFALAALALIDFLAVPLVVWTIRSGPGGEWVMMLGSGAFIAQFGVLPAWLVWGWRPYWQRMLVHGFSAASLLAAWALGFVCTESGVLLGPSPWMYPDIVPVVLVLPVISLSVETPLWFTRLAFGWRLVPPGAAPAAGRKLAIRDFLIGMSVIAVALAFARLAMNLSQPTRVENFWVPLAITVVSASVASALALPLTAWALLRLEDVRGGAAVVTVYGLAVYCLLIIAVVVFLGPADPLRFFLLLLLLQGSFTAVIAGTLALARCAGFRLYVGTSDPPRYGSTNSPRDDASAMDVGGTSG